MGDLKCEPLKLENSKEQLLVILALTLFHSSADSSRTDWFKWSGRQRLWYYYEGYKEVQIMIDQVDWLL